jgi:hypothetical protein
VRPTDEHQEGGLKRVFNVVRIAQNCPADVEHHRPVSFHQGRECQLGGLSPGAKLLDQFPVRTIPQRPDPEKSVNVPEHRGVMAVCHLSDPLSVLPP